MVINVSVLGRSLLDDSLCNVPIYGKVDLQVISDKLDHVVRQCRQLVDTQRQVPRVRPECSRHKCRG